jgi:hypothetical protein
MSVELFAFNQSVKLAAPGVATLTGTPPVGVIVVVVGVTVTVALVPMSIGESPSPRRTPDKDRYNGFRVGLL